MNSFGWLSSLPTYLRSRRRSRSRAGLLAAWLAERLTTPSSVLFFFPPLPSVQARQRFAARMLAGELPKVTPVYWHFRKWAHVFVTLTFIGKRRRRRSSMTMWSSTTSTERGARLVLWTVVVISQDRTGEIASFRSAENINLALIGTIISTRERSVLGWWTVRNWWRKSTCFAKGQLKILYGKLFFVLY